MLALPRWATGAWSHIAPYDGWRMRRLELRRDLLTCSGLEPRTAMMSCSSTIQSEPRESASLVGVLAAAACMHTLCESRNFDPRRRRRNSISRPVESTARTWPSSSGPTPPFPGNPTRLGACQHFLGNPYRMQNCHLLVCKGSI